MQLAKNLHIARYMCSCNIIFYMSKVTLIYNVTIAAVLHRLVHTYMHLCVLGDKNVLDQGK